MINGDVHKVRHGAGGWEAKITQYIYYRNLCLGLNCRLRLVGLRAFYIGYGWGSGQDWYGGYAWLGVHKARHTTEGSLRFGIGKASTVSCLLQNNGLLLIAYCFLPLQKFPHAARL